MQDYSDPQASDNTIGQSERLPRATTGFHLMYDGEGYYPRVATLDGAALIAGFDHPTPAQRELGAVFSSDHGTTWGGYRIVTADTSAADLANAFPLRLQGSPTILMACRHHNPPVYRIEVHASGDGGINWSCRSVVTTGVTGLWEPLMLQLPSGDLQIYYASEEGLRRAQRIASGSDPHRSTTIANSESAGDSSSDSVRSNLRPSDGICEFSSAILGVVSGFSVRKPGFDFRGVLLAGLSCRSRNIARPLWSLGHLLSGKCDRFSVDFVGFTHSHSRAFGDSAAADFVLLVVPPVEAAAA